MIQDQANSSQMQANQFASQVNDPELYTTMQEVIKKNKEKVHIDEKKEEGIEEEGEEKKEEENKDLAPKYGGLSKSVIQRRIQNKKLIDEFKNIFNKDNSNINDCRRCLIHIIIVVVVINCCAWEIYCLFLNICYGENIEMKQWISIILFPSNNIVILFLRRKNITMKVIKSINPVMKVIKILVFRGFSFTDSFDVLKLFCVLSRLSFTFN